MLQISPHTRILLAVELAISLGAGIRGVLFAVFLLVALVFVYRSFYGMRIQAGVKEAESAASNKAA